MARKKRVKEKEVLPPPKDRQSGVQTVDKKLVTQAVRYINEKANETVYKGSEEIGAYLLKKFFEDDIELATSKNPYKSASYTALCQREDLAVHPATLSVMVRVAAQERFFRDRKFNSAGLSYTHKAELVKLPNTEVKLELAGEVLEGSFSTRYLAEEIKKVRKELGHKAGRSPMMIERHIENPSRLFDHPERSAFISDTTNLKRMRTETRQRLLEKTAKMTARTKEWTKKYEALRKKLEEAEGE